MMRFSSLSGWIFIRLVALLLVSPSLWAEPLADDGLADGHLETGKPQRRLLVDTERQVLNVMEGDETVYQFKNIALGSNGTGASLDKRTLDEKTPLGEFTITTIRKSSRFHLFLGFDYPTMNYAEAALVDGRISQDEYEALNYAWLRKLVPPQTTGLGGYFGIHGLGAGNPKVHKLFNWTNGCIALTNEEIELLANMIEIGTPVSIH